MRRKPRHALSLAYTGMGPRRKLIGRMSSRPKTWSAWQCVINSASSRSIFSRNACWRKSAETSITRRRGPPSTGISTIRPGRSRLSRGSVDRQTEHSDPIIGTPTDVPVPRKVIRIRSGSGEWGMGSGNGNRQFMSRLLFPIPHSPLPTPQLTPHRDKLHFQVREQVVEEFLFAAREVAFGLFAQHHQHID